MGAKAIKLGSWGQTSCILLVLECHVWHMRNGINVMEYFKPVKYVSLMCKWNCVAACFVQTISEMRALRQVPLKACIRDFSLLEYIHSRLNSMYHLDIQCFVF